MQSDTTTRAHEEALRLHAGQLYGSVPYSTHLEDVVGILIGFGHDDPELLAAAWLHDSLEDTDATSDDLEQSFGRRVADLVGAVTDDPEGVNRKARKARPLRLIPTVPGALLLKLADRIANVKRALTSDSPRYIRMYRGEQGSFRDALRREGEADAMWEALERLLEVSE
jgi:(p)ppGpp synthase/HD superfamily hydrolase